MSPIRGPILRIRNARQSEAASDAASVFTQEAYVWGHVSRVYRRCLGGPGGDYRLLEVPNCKYAIRGSPRPHLALLVYLCTELKYAATADMSTVRISEAPMASIAYSRSYFANAQDEVVRRRIPLGSVLQAPSRDQFPLMAANAGNLARRFVFADSRANFCECAMQDALPLQPTRLTSPRTKQASFSTVSLSRHEIFEAPTRHRLFDGPILRIRHARQSAAA